VPGNRRPSLYNIAVGRPFADALVQGMLDRFGRDPLALAGTMLLLPSNRARSAVQAAFVRLAGEGLLLPRLVALGDTDLEESAGLALDSDLEGEPLKPAIEPLRRRLILSRLILANWAKYGLPLAAPASLGLADALARTIDQFHFEELDPKLLDSAASVDLSSHWELSKRHLQLLLDQWPSELVRIGALDLSDRRNQMLRRLVERWTVQPPSGPVIAAGISVTAPAVARLLRLVADLPQGLVVLPGLDVVLPDEEWDALGPARPDPLGERPLTGHPQYQFKLLLGRMGIARSEVEPWPAADLSEPARARAALASAMFVPAPFTGNWRARVRAGACDGIALAEFADDGAEAVGIALMLRHALETPGRTAALVTPDRGLAARVSSALARWGIVADDSAGQPLAQTPPGTLARLAMLAAVEGGLVPFIAMLVHPLVQPGGDREGWIAQVRMLDKLLRGPGMPSRPTTIATWLAAKCAEARVKGKDDTKIAALALWWNEQAERLAPLWSLAEADADLPPLRLIDALRDLLDSLSAGAVWAGPSGRQLAVLFDRWQLAAPDGPTLLSLRALHRQLDDLLAGELVRAPFGTHPRLFIWGLLEARLQRADLMILGGLNEGGWPADTSPDPWLAPGIRRQLGLPSAERAQGLAAHDFVTALGAPEVVVTRAERQGSDPAVASRLWLRLNALAPELPKAHIDGIAVRKLVDLLDQPANKQPPASRPSVAVPADARPRVVGVTALDTLVADPFAFYARQILGLRPLDELGKAVDPRWRGTRVHNLIEQWAKGAADTASLEDAIAALAADAALDPVEAALWLPRIAPALRWVAQKIDQNRAEGREPVAHEAEGKWTVGGITLTGKADRIDRTPAGLIVVDYKTGNPPSSKAMLEKRAMQLGLLAAMIEAKAFENVPEMVPSDAEYWVLKRDKEKGQEAFSKRPRLDTKRSATFEDVVERACEGLEELTRNYLLGDTPFKPGQKSGDYDHLARRDEWVGRPAQDGGA
jgi:ATP-dependent helicase/nuclease subunit B